MIEFTMYISESDAQNLALSPALAMTYNLRVMIGGDISVSVPIIEYVIRRTIEGLDMRDPINQIRVALQLVPMINAIVNLIEREHYRNRLAVVLHTTRQELFDDRS